VYIKYSSLEPIDELSKYDKRYKNYIVFNENIVTKNEFTLYDNDKEVYSFKESMRFPIIIKNDNGRYYIEFNNRLLYILKDDIKEIVKSNNTNNKNATKVTTLCYHRIYDTNEKCNDLYICKSKSNFEREMKYLSDNKFLTLTMEEMYLYLTKKIQVPKKSVVLTFDDGYLFTNGIKILEKYNLHGTGFIKTGAFSDYSIFDSPNFEIQSHTDHMHVAGTCPRENANQQGGGILCLAESKVLNDLKNSREKLNGAIALAYPFYDYNTRAVNLVKKAGFKLAFIGAAGTVGRSTPGINPLLVPRITIWNTTSFSTFKSYVNN
jgi:peptidoglycan/xylan/chitin deacetylase (PgdA/CDA1 family)